MPKSQAVNPRSPLDVLTASQLAFARAYSSNPSSPLAAYDHAYQLRGGKASTRAQSARVLLKPPVVMAAVAHLLLIQERIAGLDRAVVLAHLLRNDAVAYESGDIAASNRALELLGKALGNVFVEQVPDHALDLVREVRQLVAESRNETIIEHQKDTAGG